MQECRRWCGKLVRIKSAVASNVIGSQGDGRALLSRVINECWFIARYFVTVWAFYRDEGGPNCARELERVNIK
jgi:hypothetical protein